ncbi:hypothetical protein [Proteus sp. G2615]|uniref:hypothetical protein n=1 Tax=Proteus sp. G2615 TaxID=2698845 RepID=UPI001378B21E|nr:hypothetical protein [Proteus sp. G2615]NBN73634.1 hypothetical protein [Proteus sp. G2615]
MTEKSIDNNNEVKTSVDYSDNQKINEILNFMRNKQSEKIHFKNRIFELVKNKLNNGVLSVDDIAEQLTSFRNELVDAYAEKTELDDIPF